MRQWITRYVLLFLCLAALHQFVPSGWILAAWVLLGLLLPVWFARDRYFLLRLVLLELVAAICLMFVDGGRRVSLESLAHNSSLSLALLVTMVIGLNAITCFLCVATPYTLLRTLDKVRQLRK